MLALHDAELRALGHAEHVVHRQLAELALALGQALQTDADRRGTRVEWLHRLRRFQLRQVSQSQVSMAFRVTKLRLATMYFKNEPKSSFFFKNARSIAVLSKVQSSRILIWEESLSITSHHRRKFDGPFESTASMKRRPQPPCNS